MDQIQRRKIICRIYAALMERGYRPTDQIIGYILTGDPTYITNHKGARRVVTEVDRHELLRDMLLVYFQKGPAPLPF